MEIIRSIEAFRLFRKDWPPSCTADLCFVPTMGALHAGHASLIKNAQKRSQYVVVSIFVNPTQFGQGEDYEEYPRPIKHDIDQLKMLGVRVVFVPLANQVYPPGFRTNITVGKWGRRLCGRSRPNHFLGVATVVLKLFNIVCPTVAFFGQKDAQQVVLIKRMTQDLNLDIEIFVCPIIREKDGLAVSSRNRYLTVQERRAAVVLSQCLTWATQEVEMGERNVQVLVKGIHKKIGEESLARLDYVSIVEPNDLKPIRRLNKISLLVFSVFIGKTRLIDNTILWVEKVRGGKSYSISKESVL